ncbi:MAG TPA: hypothetical protein VGK26_01675 [Thermoanaerobaculia bacterium]
MNRLPFLCRRPFLWTLVVLGAALRLFQYASDTSLWYDELSIVRNLVERSASQLLRAPLGYDQVAPVGFMVAEKAISRWLGESDLAFRLLLLLVGLASLVLFVPLARRLLDGYAVPFAVAAFAIGAPFIRYSAEVKSYGIDVFATIALSLLALRLRDADATAARRGLAAAAGAVLVWFSQPTLFVVAGLGGALVLAWLRDRDAPTRRAVVAVVPVWAVASAAAAVVAIRRVTPTTRAYMDAFWRFRDGFFPRPFRRPGDALWLWNRIVEFFGDPMLLRYRWPALSAALAVVGAAALWRRNRFGALVLLCPFGAGVLAAVAQQFPFKTRVALFVFPILMLAAAQGAEWIRRQASRLHPVVGAAVMAALFVIPTWSFIEYPPPYWVEDFKTVFAFFREHRRPGDAVFVFPYAVEAVERYGPEYGLAPVDYEVGGCSAEDPRLFLRDVDRYRGRPRVWLLVGSVPSMTADRRSVEGYLSAIGVAGDRISIPSLPNLDPVAAQLYDLSDPVRLASASPETFPLAPRGPLKPPCSDRVRRSR